MAAKNTPTTAPRRTTARAINKTGTSLGAVLDSTSSSSSSSRASKKPASAAAKRKKVASRDSNDDDDDDAATQLLAKVDHDTRKGSSKRQRGNKASAAILDEFLSLDALLDTDAALERKKQARDRKLQSLRDACDPTGASATSSSPLGKLMRTMASSLSSLSSDSALFSAASGGVLAANHEKFGYVFAPITAPLESPAFEPTPTEVTSDLARVYKAMAATNVEELGALLWSKAILLRCVLAAHVDSAKSDKDGSSDDVEVVAAPVLVPARICVWLFTTMSTHSSSHIIRGCLSNLFLMLGPSHRTAAELHAGLPSASFCQPIENFKALLLRARTNASSSASLQMAWTPRVYDFLHAFRLFGFHDSKRSMSTKSKIVTPPPPPPPTAAAADAAWTTLQHPPGDATTTTSSSSNNPLATLPFPALNMQYVLTYFVLCLRANVLQLDGYDAFSFVMFFLRMQFESGMHPEIVELASLCIEELLEVFPKPEWRKEWAPSLVLRIAGVHEGLFDSPAGWLTVARRLPRTLRGTQLTTGLSIYVLQHRIDKVPTEGLLSERPLKFPIQSGLVLDIVAGIVEDLTSKYTERGGATSKSKASPPPYDVLCKKVALMDLALQAFLNILTQKEMALLLAKLDALTGTHKSTMSAKWHELKTLVSLMHRKYSLENLRVGRDTSPKAKTTLFVDDATSN